MVDRYAPPPNLSHEKLLGGWWRRQDSDHRVTPLPNPWDDREILSLYDDYSWELTKSVCKRLGRRLNEFHQTEHSNSYWRLLLGPWVLTTISTVIDRRLFCRTVKEICPGKPLFFRQSSIQLNQFTIAQTSNIQHEDAWNTKLIIDIARKMNLPTIEIEHSLDETREKPNPFRRAQVLLARIRVAPRVAIRALFSASIRRRVILLGFFPLSTRQLLTLTASVRGLRVASPFQVRRGDSWYHASFTLHPIRYQALSDSTGDEVEQLVDSLIPKVLPCSALETYEDLVAESNRRYGSSCNALAGSYFWDDLENEFLARSYEDGKKISFCQHGGVTHQLAVTPGEHHEHYEGCETISWGAEPPGVKAAPYPNVQLLRDSYQRRTDDVLIVENCTDFTYPHTFSSTPIGNQAFEAEVALAEFVKACGNLSTKMVLKRFAGSNPDLRHPELAKLRIPSSRSQPAINHMRKARIVIIPYPGTPFIEALLIGVPTIGLWKLEAWNMRSSVIPFFDELASAGIIYHDPKNAALKLNEIYNDTDGWWNSPHIQTARCNFLNRFAIAGDPIKAWSNILSELSTYHRISN